MVPRRRIEAIIAGQPPRTLQEAWDSAQALLRRARVAQEHKKSVEMRSHLIRARELALWLQDYTGARNATSRAAAIFKAADVVDPSTNIQAERSQKQSVRMRAASSDETKDERARVLELLREGKTLRQIGKKLEMTVQVVSARLERARELGEWTARDDEIRAPKLHETLSKIATRRWKREKNSGWFDI